MNKLTKKNCQHTPFSRWVWAKCKNYHVTFDELGAPCGYAARQMRRHLNGQSAKLPLDVILTVVEVIAVITGTDRSALLDDCMEAITTKWRQGNPTINVDRVQMRELSTYWEAQSGK